MSSFWKVHEMASFVSGALRSKFEIFGVKRACKKIQFLGAGVPQTWISGGAQKWPKIGFLVGNIFR